MFAKTGCFGCIIAHFELICAKHACGLKKNIDICKVLLAAQVKLCENRLRSQ